MTTEHDWLDSSDFQELIEGLDQTRDRLRWAECNRPEGDDDDSHLLWCMDQWEYELEGLRTMIRAHFVPRGPLERLILEQENDNNCFYREDIAHEASYVQDRLRELHKLIRGS